MKCRLWAAALMICLCLAVPVVGVCAEKNQVTIEEYFSAEESYSGYVEVPGKGQMYYYAQNDKLWGMLTYESKKSTKDRPFRDGGCCPTAVAMAIVQMIPVEELDMILDSAKEPYSLCTHSINRVKCARTRCRERYTLTTGEQFQRFLPLVIADFAMGNNTFGVLSRTEEKGTDVGFIDYAAQAYGLEVSIVTTIAEATAAMQDGKAVIAFCTKGSAFSNGGHYVVLAHADEEKLYVFDPYSREKYETENGRRLEIIQPGLVAIEMKYFKLCNFVKYYVFSYAQPAAEMQ